MDWSEIDWELMRALRNLAVIVWVIILTLRMRWAEARIEWAIKTLERNIWRK